MNSYCRRREDGFAAGKRRRHIPWRCDIHGAAGEVCITQALVRHWLFCPKAEQWQIPTEEIKLLRTLLIILIHVLEGHWTISVAFCVSIPIHLPMIKCSFFIILWKDSKITSLRYNSSIQTSNLYAILMFKEGS